MGHIDAMSPNLSGRSLLRWSQADGLQTLGNPGRAVSDDDAATMATAYPRRYERSLSGRGRTPQGNVIFRPIRRNRIVPLGDLPGGREDGAPVKRPGTGNVIAALARPKPRPQMHSFGQSRVADQALRTSGRPWAGTLRLDATRARTIRYGLTTILGEGIDRADAERLGLARHSRTWLARLSLISAGPSLAYHCAVNPPVLIATTRIRHAADFEIISAHISLSPHKPESAPPHCAVNAPAASLTFHFFPGGQKGCLYFSNGPIYYCSSHQAHCSSNGPDCLSEVHSD